MPYFVYILYSDKYNKYYTGYTANLNQRLLAHNALSKKGWTIKFRPWRLIYSEEFLLKKDALKKEKWFKSGIGRAFIKNLPK